eukprot:607004-Pleurochrysis_carterae.AAC.1
MPARSASSSGDGCDTLCGQQRRRQWRTLREAAASASVRFASISGGDGDALAAGSGGGGVDAVCRQRWQQRRRAPRAATATALFSSSDVLRALLHRQPCLAVAAIAIARKVSVSYESGSCVIRSIGQLLPGAGLHHHKKGKKPAISRCRHAHRGIHSTHKRASLPPTHPLSLPPPAQRCINANDKTCKSASPAINLGIYNLDLNHVTVTVSVNRAPTEVRFAYEKCADAALQI